MPEASGAVNVVESQKKKCPECGAPMFGYKIMQGKSLDSLKPKVVFRCPTPHRRMVKGGGVRPAFIIKKKK